MIPIFYHKNNPIGSEIRTIAEEPYVTGIYKCYEMRDRLVEQMKEKQGVTEKLKAENQMMWVGKMNNLIACAEEIV